MVLSISIKNKSQIWSIDFIIAIFMFLCVLVIFYKYSISIIDAEEQDVNDLLLDAQLISNYLVSTGYPENWTTSDVTLIGLTDGKMRLSGEKVEQFSDIALSDYVRSRRLLSAVYDYNVSFEDRDGSSLKIGDVTSIGKSYADEDPKNLIKIIRFVFYNSKIIKMVLCVW